MWLCAGGLKEDLEYLYGIQDFGSWLWEYKTFSEKCVCNTKEERIMGHVFVLVCDFNGKWLKFFYVFLCALGYVEGSIVF